jgi:uncharacterized membrane protein
MDVVCMLKFWAVCAVLVAIVVLIKRDEVAVKWVRKWPRWLQVVVNALDAFVRLLGYFTRLLVAGFLLLLLMAKPAFQRHRTGRKRRKDLLKRYPALQIKPPPTNRKEERAASLLDWFWRH